MGKGAIDAEPFRALQKPKFESKSNPRLPCGLLLQQQRSAHGRRRRQGEVRPSSCPHSQKNKKWRFACFCNTRFLLALPSKDKLRSLPQHPTAAWVSPRSTPDYIRFVELTYGCSVRKASKLLSNNYQIIK